MAKPSEQDVVRALLDRHGRTYAEELRIDVGKNTPSELFRLLCASTLMSARISSSIAVDAARGLTKRGWRSARKLSESTWDERVEALHEAGYTRYQERTATQLGDLAGQVLDRWGGDLRKLREAAGQDPKRERKLLKEFKGIGEVGADIFLREVQVAWEELSPFADRRAREAAGRLGLPKDPEKLAGLVERRDVPRLVAALVRAGLEDGEGAVRDAADHR